METDMGEKVHVSSPQGYYDADDIQGNFNQEHEHETEPNPEPPHQWYSPPPAPMMFMPPTAPGKRDIFSEIDKTTYIIAFVVFILGFFMGKTMQPVILRPM